MKLSLLLEKNQCVFVYEDNTWAVKGRYGTAIAQNDEVAWSLLKQKFMLRLLIVRICDLAF